MANDPWTDEENDLIVADYFEMLICELTKRSYSKAGHCRAILPLLRDRSSKSISYKHQNISAVLKSFGENWIDGYKPMFNFQQSLVEAVARWFARNQGWRDKFLGPNDLPEQKQITMVTAPNLSNQPPPKELEKTLGIARKFNVAGRDERNRSLGLAGEKCVLAHERTKLKKAGRDDLARKVRWVSQEDGDGAGYDIYSFAPKGQSRLIEVKTTNGWERTPFYITKNELAVADERRSEWCLFRVWNYSCGPRAFELYPPLEAHVLLTGMTFQAVFQ